MEACAGTCVNGECNGEICADAFSSRAACEYREVDTAFGKDAGGAGLACVGEEWTKGFGACGNVTVVLETHGDSPKQPETEDKCL